jgi:hypothetical protein
MFAVIAVRSMDFVLLEGILFLFALGWVIWAWRVREVDSPPPEVLAPPEPIQISASRVAPGQIEESKYD